MNTINAEFFKKMITNGAHNLANHHHEIDKLNVFPVPDGDTGTNMSLTFTSGMKDCVNCNSDSVADLAKALSKGLLMGARGNSGVITSQIFRGVYQGLEDVAEVNSTQLANAFVNGSRVAYKAVMRPVEGTILTVIRLASENTLKYVESTSDLTCDAVMEKLLEEAKLALQTTPDLLPVLKEVGVVDSGGAGLVAILEGFVKAFKGEVIELKEQDNTAQANSAATLEDHDEFGYCTEFIIRLDEMQLASFDEQKLRELLSKLGNSLVVVQDDDIVKVHVHTLKPGDALNLAQRYGEFVKIKIENMQEQHENIIIQEQEKARYGLIAVAAGDGLKDAFKDLRVDYLISGGQTMNPSTEDFVAAIKKVNAQDIFVLPNNSNIVLAAKQASEVVEDKNIHVIETKSIPQGLCACMMFNPDASVEENIEEMNEAKNNVVTGQVTYAIKDTTFDGMAISAGDYMGIKEKDIIASVQDKMSATKTLIDTMMNDDAEIMTIIAGEDTSDEEIEKIDNYVSDKGIDTEVIHGNQPVYSFILGLE